MSFFGKDQTQKNLQYDDIAFLHFLLTISLGSVILFGFLVYKRLKQASVKNIKNYKKLKESGLFGKQIQNQAKKLRKQKITADFFLMVGLFIGGIVLSVGLAVFIGTHTTQMIGFDPHQILGVAPDATVNQIKKAYRKLALQFHPDRNPNNPQAHGKFIMISKSYECLTDEQKKQNCQKYGNPDGQSSFQVGIGLPKFIISQENQFVILPIVFFFLLVVIPILFIKWTKSLKTRDTSGIDIANFPALYPFYRPDFNASFGFYLVTVLKELETDKKLNDKLRQQFMGFLAEKKLVDLKYVNQQMSEGQIYTLHALLKQMALKQPDQDLCLQLPQLLNGLMKFSLLFAKRINDKKPLFGDKYPINFIGTQHIFMLLQFIRTFYNCSLFNPPVFMPFDHLDLAKQDRQVSFKNPLNNLRLILESEQKKQQHLSQFPDHHKQYIQRQVNDLPIINLQIKCMLGKQQVHEFTVEDFPQIYFKVSKSNSTSGYCFLNKFPYLKEEKYYFMFIFGNNLLHFQEVTFQEGKSQFVGKFPYRQSIAKQMKYFAFAISDCRYGLDAKAELSFNVVQPKQEDMQKGIQFHHQDLTIEKGPKGYFEKILSLETQNPSDNELSDSQDEEPAKKKKGLKMQEEKGGCHDCKDHDH